MSDDSLHPRPPQDPPGTDGWVDGSEATAAPPQPPPQRLPVPAHDTTFDPPRPDDVDDGKALAVLSHASLLFGIPVFIIPMLQKDNDFALHHSKAAAVNFIFFLVSMTLTVLTCGLAAPLIFFCYIPAIVGGLHAANGELAGRWGWGRAGERLFSGLRVRKPAQLE